MSEKSICAEAGENSRKEAQKSQKVGRAEIFALPFLCFLRFFAAIPLRLTVLASSVIEGSSGKTNFAPC